jgi:phage FluMu protein Com
MAELPCHHCGYDLVGLHVTAQGRQCPECGGINEIPCFHCGHNIAGVPDYGDVKVCPKCGGLTPDVVGTPAKWAKRKWLIPIGFGAIVGIAALLVGWFDAGHDPNGVLLALLICVAVPIVAVLNGIITLTMWLDASKPHAKARRSARLVLAAVSAGLAAAVLTAIVGEVALEVARPWWN